jgi:hypothetical protein
MQLTPQLLTQQAQSRDAAISSTAAIQQSKISGSPGFRNIIINGDMSIAQRSTSVASLTSSGYYTVDRFKNSINSFGTWTQSQSTDVPTGQGFATSLKLDCTTADASPSASDTLSIEQLIEGQNLQYLKKGTANAVSLTTSFWVKSNKTGTYIAELYDGDNTRQISAAYTVNVSDTWEKKTITFPGDTTGAFDNDNAVSLYLIFHLGAGSDFTSGTLNTSWNSATNANRAVGQVNLADDTANEWYITGVQLEAGTTASDFEFLPVDVNLARCQRYYYKQKAVAQYNTFGAGLCDSTILPQAMTVFPVTMRTAPTALEQSGTAGDYILRIANSNPVCTVVPQFTTACSFSATYFFEVASGLTAGQAMFARANNTNAFLAWSAEL